MRCLITDITGTLGQAVTKILLEEGHEVTGYSRDELKQSQLPFVSKVTLYLGDIRDKERLVEASRGKDIIFHFAALKRVDALQENPEEAYKTNVLGTDNVLHAQRHNGIPRVVLSSTDKAAYPINVYGCTKQIAESLVLRNPNNVVCRYGNVLASRGSAVPVFVDAIKRGKPVPITDTRMTRFFIRIEDAAKFVVASSMGVTGGLKIPPMRGCKMTSVASAIALLLGHEYSLRDVGCRPGEKLAECLRMEHEGGAVFSDNAEQYTESELIELIRPIVGEFV